MNETMYEEIMDQPIAIKESLPILREQLLESKISLTTTEDIIFSGSGDSFFAGQSLVFAGNKLTQKNFQVLPSQEALSYWSFTKRDLFVPISISGETKRTILAAQKAKKDGAFVLAITTNIDSSLAKVSDEVLVIPFKSRTRLTPHTTDYLTTLLAIGVIIEKFNGKVIDLFDKLSDLVSKSLEDLSSKCSAIGEKIADRDIYYFFGVGPNYGTALYGAAKFWEARGIRALPFELDEVGHGAHLMLQDDDVVFIPTANGETHNRIVESVKAFKLLGVNSVVISNKPEDYINVTIMDYPDVAEEWSPFLSCLPLQLMCWSISNTKKFDVLEDGRFKSKEIYGNVLKLMRNE